MNQIEAMRDTVALMDDRLVDLHQSLLTNIGRLDASLRPEDAPAQGVPLPA